MDKLTDVRPGAKGPEAFTAGSMEWLAACILEDRALEKRQRPGAPMPWYFFFPQHPAVKVMLDAYKRRLGLAPGIALSDMERTVWELQMLSEDAVNALARYYAARKEYAGVVRRTIAGEIDFYQLLAE
ncbi:MAG: hypothetical protein IJ347_03180 [Faecalibacterium sp.]|nr:hypothetical protein [Faecalibacterium sp.]